MPEYVCVCERRVLNKRELCKVHRAPERKILTMQRIKEEVPVQYSIFHNKSNIIKIRKERFMQ